MLKPSAVSFHHMVSNVDTIQYYMFTQCMAPRRTSRPDRLEIEMLTQDIDTDTPQFRTWVGELRVDGAFFVHRGEGRMSLIQLHLECRTPFTEITPTLIRNLDLAEFVRASKAAIAEQASYFTPEKQTALGNEADLHMLSERTIKRARARIKAASRAGRVPSGAARGRGDAFYRRVALDLIELVESGRDRPGGVLEALAAVEARRLHLSEVPVQTLRTWLRIARQKQFLAPGERGRLVAIPGPLLYLSEENDD